MIKKVQLFFEDKVFACFCLFAACLFVYRNMLQNGFLSDDFTWIVYWDQLRAGISFPRLLLMPLPSEIEGVLFLPFRNIFHAINASLFGATPFGHHLFSLIAHCAAIFLVYKISFKLTSNSLVSFLAALIFTLHPFQASLVSFSSGGVEIMGACFIFLSFSLFQNARRTDGGFNGGAYCGSFVFFLIALGTHQAAVAMPFLLLLFAVNFSRDMLSQRKGLILWPFFVASFAFIGFRFFVLNEFVPISLLQNSIMLTFFVMLKALAKYIILFCFPYVVSVNHLLSPGIYSFAPADFDKIAVLTQSLFDVSVIFSFSVVGMIIYFMLASKKKNPLVSFCCGWFVISLIPFLFGGRGQIFFAQKYCYVASMGGALLMAVVLNKLSAFEPKNGCRWGAKCFIGIVCMMICFYGVKVIKRNVETRYEVSLLEADIKHVSKSRLSKFALVEAYIEHGLFDRAHARLMQLRELYTEDPQVFYLMAKSYLKQRKDVLAIEALKGALKIDPFFADAYYRLAGIYKKWGEEELAMQFLQKAYYAYSKKGEMDSLEEFVDQFLSRYQNNDTES